MKKMRKVLVGVLALAMVMALSLPMVASAEGEYTVHAKCDWESPSLWAWTADGKNLFGAWPGEAIPADESNSGWFAYTVPGDIVNIIINNGEGTEQTADVTVEPKELWITVGAADASGKFTSEVVYEAPEGFVTAAAPADDAAAEEVPKTGEAFPTLLVVGLAACAGLVLVTNKKTKNA